MTATAMFKKGKKAMGLGKQNNNFAPASCFNVALPQCVKWPTVTSHFLEDVNFKLIYSYCKCCCFDFLCTTKFFQDCF